MQRGKIEQSRAEQTHPGARAAAAGHPLAPGWALAASRALRGEGLARRVLEMRRSQWGRGLCTAPAGKEEPGKLKLVTLVTHFSHFR